MMILDFAVRRFRAAFPELLPASFPDPIYRIYSLILSFGLRVRFGLQKLLLEILPEKIRNFSKCFVFPGIKSNLHRGINI